ncbi:MAG TPA: hypothetical protein VL285_18455 [Bryobacteraceae bacterium]|nr:hypothetical protein [Bryobacteraceae bacterium]
MKNAIVMTLILAASAAAQPAAGKKGNSAAEPMVDEKYGSAEEIMALPPARLVAILNDSGASVYARAKACQRLAVVGDKSATPALAALLGHPQLAYYARAGLEQIPDSSADEALRSALHRVDGNLLVGVINSISRRAADKKAIPDLERLRHHADNAVARAADAALARLRPPL